MAALGTRKLILKVDGTDFSDSVSQVVVRAGESDADFISFAEAAAGGARKYTLVMTLKQDTAAVSLWYFAWSQNGETVDYEIWPNGGTVESATTPKFTGSLVVMEPNGDFLGGEADPSTTKFFTAEFEWDLTAKPTLDITGA